MPVTPESTTPTPEEVAFHARNRMCAAVLAGDDVSAWLGASDYRDACGPTDEHARTVLAAQHELESAALLHDTRAFDAASEHYRAAVGAQDEAWERV